MGDGKQTGNRSDHPSHECSRFPRAAILCSLWQHASSLLASVAAMVSRSRSDVVAIDVLCRLVESDMIVDLAQESCWIPSPHGGEKRLAVYVTRHLCCLAAAHDIP